jgi:hypothetical protein
VAVAVAICVWAVWGVDGAALATALGRADLWLIAAVMLTYTAIFYALDVVGFVLVYRRHLVRSVPAWHVTVIVCGKQLLGVIFPLLTKVVAPVYFRRRWGIGVLRTLGATELLSFADAVAVIVFVTAGVAWGGLQLPTVLLVVGACWWVYLVLYLAWVWLPAGGRVLPRLRRSEFFAVFSRARPAELAIQVALRSLLAVAMFGALWLLLIGAGHRLDLGQLATFGALFLFGLQLPISIGGYGAPQGISVLLLADSWHLMSHADAVAFSVLWSAAFLASRAVLSAPFAAPMTRLLSRPPGIPMTEVTPCAAAPNAT